MFTNSSKQQNKSFLSTLFLLTMTYIKAYIKREKIGLNPMIRVTLFSMGK